MKKFTMFWKVFIYTMCFVVVTDLIAMYYDTHDIPLNPIMGFLGCIWFFLNWPVFAFWFLIGWAMGGYIGFYGAFFVGQVVWWWLLARILASFLNWLKRKLDDN